MDLQVRGQYTVCKGPDSKYFRLSGPRDTIEVAMYILIK